MATDPFQLALAAVTDEPDCVQVALHPWLTFWLASGKANASVQPFSGSPRLVTVIVALSVLSAASFTVPTVWHEPPSYRSLSGV